MSDRNWRAKIFSDMRKYLESKDGRDRYGDEEAKVYRMNCRDVKVPETKEEFETKMHFVDKDTLSATKEYSQSMNKTFTFIDLASSNPRQFGGGCRTGARAQEEDLCRRSSLSNCFDLAKPPVPLYGGVFCENVYILTDTEDNNFEWYEYDDVVKANCIMVAALRKPKLNYRGGSQYFSKTDYNITKFKIMSMLNILLKKNQHHLILGALGCGAYGNPPHEVAEIFAALLKNEYKNKFHTVVFAIIDNKYTSNLQVFRETFKRDDIKLKYIDEEDGDIVESSSPVEVSLSGKGKSGSYSRTQNKIYEQKRRKNARMKR